MQLYVCCPNDDCGTFQRSMAFFNSHGIEPSLEHDGTHHYLEFSIPEEWDLQRKIDFNWQIAERTSGRVYCVCGRWLNEDLVAMVSQVRCPRCRTDYNFCKECNAMERWAGCDCRKG
jgi:hypothetical protein